MANDNYSFGNQGSIQLIISHPIQDECMILEKTSKHRIIRFYKCQDKYYFYYASPSLGTRVAILDAAKIALCDELNCFLTWSVDRIALSIGEVGIGNAQLHTVEGTQSKARLKINKDGVICQFGSDVDGVVEPLKYNIIQGGKVDITSDAIDSWMNNINAIRTLLAAVKIEDYSAQCILCNMCISSLVTSYEVYCQRRFIELLQDDIYYDKNKLAKLIRNDKLKDHIIGQCVKEDELIQYIQSNVNFQNYDTCKSFYKTFGIKFGEFEDERILSNIQRILEYRHYIIHVEPDCQYLNLKYHGESPVFSKPDLVLEYLQTFSKFIIHLHYQSIQKLRIEIINREVHDVIC